MKIWITTNGRPSDSAELISKQPGFGRSLKGGRIKPDDIVINWGSASKLKLDKSPKRVYNSPEAVLRASNKLRTFKEFSEHNVPTPAWTTDAEVAKGWDHTVFARTKLSGHSGDGIVIVPKGDDIPEAPLYTYYIFKEREFRVHVVNGRVIDTQRKIRDTSREVTSWKIRSHENGFIFARNGLTADPELEQVAINAIAALGLDFGAVDIIQDKDNKYYVLEVNTAPGLEGATVTNYTNAFMGLVDESVL